MEGLGTWLVSWSLPFVDASCVACVRPLCLGVV